VSVARDAKEAHLQRPRASISKPSSGTGTPSNGAARRSSSGNDDDLDLDFVAEPAQLNNVGFGKAKGSASADGTAVIQQPLHRAIMEHRPSLSANVSPTPAHPVHSPNALSRAFASTMGRLGRWKRALNSGLRHAADLGLTDVSAFDMELNSDGDVRGMEQYNITGTRPDIANPTPQALPPVLPLLASLDPLSSLNLRHPVPPTPPPAFTVVTAGSPEPDNVLPSTPTSGDSLTAAIEAAHHAMLANMIPPVEVSLRGKLSSRTSTSSTSSSSSYGVPVAPQAAFYADRSALERSWQLDVVSIDDLDLSDTSSDTSERRVVQSGSKKPPRRLPLRRAFEFVNRNRESVSSMGFASQDGSGPSASNSRRSSAVSGSGLDGGLGNTIQQWQVNALIDSLSDDEDDGDVEDALRRLEGQMNRKKQRAKATKVDNWVKTIRDRLVAGDYGDEAPRYLSDGEEAPSEAGTEEDAGARGSALFSVLSSPSRPGSPASVRHVSSFGVLVDHTTPVPSQTPQPGSVSSAALRSAKDMKPAVEDAVPAEILRGRLMAPNVAPMVVAKIPSTPARLPTMYGSADYHRSWVLSVPTVSLAVHFSMIDRELFLAIKFEELVSDDWRGPEAAQVANVLDWGQFLKDRARWKAQGVEGYHTSALVAARARFNLVTSFVISEIVDTPPAHRPSLVSKFIRVAWVRTHYFYKRRQTTNMLAEMLPAEQL
jgi:GDP/GTP exchange factor required for growth at low temperature